MGAGRTLALQPAGMLGAGLDESPASRDDLTRPLRHPDRDRPLVNRRVLVGHRCQFLASHFTRRSPPSEISPHIHSAGSVAVLVTWRQRRFNCTPHRFQVEIPPSEEFLRTYEHELPMT